jgi:catechol 2,3-dioxygenase-like lactoylglutathione lyase family enzyme
VTAMDITIRASFLPHDDPEASLAFYRDVLGFGVRGDVGRGRTRRLTVGPVGQAGTSVVLHPAGDDPELLLAFGTVPFSTPRATCHVQELR